MIHSVKLLCVFSFIGGVIVFAIDAAGFSDALAMGSFLLLMSGAYVLLAAVDRACFRSRSKPICGEISHDH